MTTRDLEKRNKDGEKGITEDTKFILMSSLNTDESVVWESTVWNNAIQTDVMLCIRFLEIDSLVAKYKEAAKDQIDYSIWIMRWWRKPRIMMCFVTLIVRMILFARNMGIEGNSQGLQWNREMI